MSVISRRWLLGAVIVAAAIVAVMPAGATDVTTEWATIQLPPPPALKAVAVEPKTTALLLLDFMTGNCGERPRCVAAVPTLKALHDKARAAGMLIAYTLPGGGKIIDQGIAPHEGEVVEQKPGGPDKFLGSNLEEKLKAGSIKTVVVCGTSFQGVGVGTGSGLAQRGYKVIVPIDCLSSEDAYNEQYAAWHMFKGGPAVVTSNSTLTRSTMVKFSK